MLHQQGMNELGERGSVRFHHTKLGVLLHICHSETWKARAQTVATLWDALNLTAHCSIKSLPSLERAKQGRKWCLLNIKIILSSLRRPTLFSSLSPVCLPFCPPPPPSNPPISFPLPAFILIPPSFLSLSLCQFSYFLHAFVYLSRCLLLTLEVIRDPWAAIPECWAD